MASGEERARWARLQELFEAALALPPGVRAHHLQATIPDPGLRAEVAALIEAHEGEGRLDDLAAALATTGGEGATVRGEAPVPERVGPYRVLEAIGSGGMGSVLLARREGDDGAEPVAVKLLRADADSGRVRRRFLAEREILARIDHPDIARPIDDGFTADGLPYFVMEFVDGLPIDDFCDGRRLPIAERLGLFVAVCEAVEHAHRIGVVHRDLKPGNILVGADGRVRLLDFGIAKILDDRAFPGLARRTTTGVHLLTPEYASPEQLLDAPITQASDQYQLGLLLYLLVTGRMPSVAARIAGHVPGGSARDLGVRPPSHLWSEPDPSTGGFRDGAAAARSSTPDGLARRLRDGLDAIVMKALSERPSDRFRSVGSLADRLRPHAGLGRARSWREGGPGLDSRVRGRPDAHRRPKRVRTMKRILGMGVGVVYFGLAFVAYARASAGWDAGYDDIGFWWTVITAFLGIAALSALVGTWIHTQERRG